MASLSDWRKYLSGGDIEPAVFERFFDEDRSHQDVEEIFDGANRKEVAVERTLSALKARHRPAEDLAGADLLECAMAKVREDRLVCRLAQEDLSLPSTRPKVVTYQELWGVLLGGGFDSAVRDTISDFFVDLIDWEDRLAIGLKSALYGISNDYEVGHYIMAPIVNSPCDFEQTFRLWSSGYKVAYLEDAVLVGKFRRD